MVKIKKKQIMKLLTFIILIVLSYYNQDTIIYTSSKFLNSKDFLSSKTNYSFDNLKSNINYGKTENMASDISVEFCPSIDCFNLLNKSLASANHEIKCAFYELDEKNIVLTLLSKSRQGINISLIVDDRYLEEDNFKMLLNTSIQIYSDINRHTRYNNYMHDKYCVIDDKVLITGSMNPTENGVFKNNNNLLRIESNYLARNYENDFNQMSSEIFGEKKKSTLEFNNISLIYKNKSYEVSSYLCPEDSCDKEVSKVLNGAKKSIYFASFALTLDEFADILENKSKSGLDVEGLIEKRNLNLKGSDIKRLNETFRVYLDKNKNNMHHKFFIIDKKIVITGSMNPSKSGTKYNDENILIIKNFDLAERYFEEFEKLIR